MSEYRSVNFYELCRLCAASQGTKLNLFSDSARKQALVDKIGEFLPVTVEEHDSLPKTICETCIQQLQMISEYRQKCLNTQSMLEGCLGTSKLKNEGRVYIKDDSRAGPGGCKPATNIVTLKNSSVKPTLVPLVQQQQQQTTTQQQQQQTTQQVQQQLDTNTMTISSNDYLSSIVQSVKMEDGSDSSAPQYTFTIKEIQPTLTTNDQQRMQTYSQVDEFLKPKTDGKPQYNFVLNPNGLSQIATQSTTSPQIKQVLPTSQPNQYVLATNSGMRTVTAQPAQQQQKIQMVQSPTKQCLIMKDNNQQVYQLKLEPQMTTVDGQTIYQLNPITQTFQAAPQQQEQTILTRPQQTQGKIGTPIQFTTLTNATTTSNVTKASPTMITIQETPGKGQTATQITPVGRIASTTITRKTPLVLKPENSNTLGQVKYITSTQGTTSVQSSAPILVSSATNNGGMASAPKVLNKNPRTVVVGNKAVKMISAQPGVKTITVSPPKRVIPVQTINATTSDGDGMTIQFEVENKDKPTCDVCQKEFKRKEHLVQHMKLHQGVRPFKCDQCEKAFNRKEHLLRHRTSHTGAKSFKCEHCQKMFSRKDNLNKHKRKHTGEDDDGSGKKVKMDDEPGEGGD